MWSQNSGLFLLSAVYGINLAVPHVNYRQSNARKSWGEKMVICVFLFFSSFFFLRPHSWWSLSKCTWQHCTFEVSIWSELQPPVLVSSHSPVKVCFRSWEDNYMVLGTCGLKFRSPEPTINAYDSNLSWRKTPASWHKLGSSGFHSDSASKNKMEEQLRIFPISTSGLHTHARMCALKKNL